MGFFDAEYGLAAASLERLAVLVSYWKSVYALESAVVVAGFGKETGWRGCLIERLVLSHGRARATLVVGLLSAFWHTPLFWLNAGMSALVGPVLIGWVFSLVCGAFVWSYVYVVTGHSILCVALWHAGFNMLVATEGGTGWLATIVSAAVMACGVVVAVRWWRRERLPVA